MRLKRWDMVVVGAFFLLWWVGCSAVTTVPGSEADHAQQVGDVVLPILAVLIFCVAARRE